MDYCATARVWRWVSAISIRLGLLGRLLIKLFTFTIDPQLISNIRSSNILIPNIRQLATTRTSTPASSIGGTPRSHHTQHSYQDTDAGEGQGEIQLLARRILDFTDGDGDGAVTPNAPASQMQAGSLIESRAESVMGRDHEELRRSVREAFSAERASGTH